MCIPASRSTNASICITLDLTRGFHYAPYFNQLGLDFLELALEPAFVLHIALLENGLGISFQIL
jgi:hypothetical protein